MGIYHECYLEGHADGRWFPIGPYAKNADGGPVLLPVLEGKSWAWEVIDALDEQWGDPPSDETLAAIGWDDDDYTEARTYRLPDVDRIARPYEYEGFAHRDGIAAYENGACEHIADWVLPEEYGALPDEEKSRYAPYRWDSRYGAYPRLRDLAAVAAMLAAAYDENAYRFGLPHPLDGTRLVVISG